MTSPVLALRAAIRAACVGDAVLATLMDTAIHDEAPRGRLPVYATFGDVTARDASSSTERGHEQEAAILLWAKPASAASALAAADRLAALLDDADLALVGHHLVALAVTAIEADRDEAGGLRVAVRLRAVTEERP